MKFAKSHDIKWHVNESHDINWHMDEFHVIIVYSIYVDDSCDVIVACCGFYDIKVAC